MTDTSEFEDVVEIMMDKNEFKDCLDYIETKIDQNVVLDTPYLFDTKLNCLYELDRKMDAFMEAKAYRADYRPLTPIVCMVLGNGYEKEDNYTEAHFYFAQCVFDDQDATLSRLVKEIEREVKKKFDEEKYEECLNYIETMRQDLVSSNEDIFDCKVKCLSELDRKQGEFKLFYGEDDGFDKSPMSLVKATKKHLENLNLLKSWGYDLPYMARVESALPPNSISSDPLLVVERIQPLHVFFTLEREEFMKTNSSCASKERDWWECIRERFQLIFRDIICGFFFLHSSNRVCSYFRDSLYVSKEGRGKILHNFSKEFSFAHAQEDVKDLLMLVEVAIGGPACQLVGSKNRTCQLEEMGDSFNLPEELVHFLLSLNRHHENVALGKLPSTWLIDHPFFWDDKHRISFIKYLKDGMKESLTLEAAFNYSPEFEWETAVKDDLLYAILEYKRYSYRSNSSIVFYMNAVYSHINDHRYKKIRGDRKLDEVEIESLLRKTFPKVYTFLFDALCKLLVDNPMCYTEILKKLSSCCVIKYDRRCLKELS